MIRPLAILLAVAPLLAGASIQARIDPNGADVSIAGRAEFCTAHADLCEDYGPATVPDSQQFRSWLEAVNATVNGAITYRAAVDAAWKIYPVEGDCNDIAATKLAVLVRSGLPRRALRLAVVQVGQPKLAMNGDVFTFWSWHMVLTVETDRGTLVLDSLRSGVTEWQPSNDRTWYALEAPRQGRMAFVRLRSQTAAGFEEVK
jgi:predicted transglutaminase-like cysteine proteinase